MPHPCPSHIVALRARLAGHAFELAAIKLQLVLRKATFNPDQPRIPAGQPGGGQWTGDGGGGTADGDRNRSRITRGSKPVRLAQLGGASTMTDIGPTAGPFLGAILVAPQGRAVGSFIVSPLTNNVYDTPFGPVDVTGWTAYYGPPGSELGGQTYRDGVLWFVNPTRSRAHLERVSPGM